jgi:DNA-directed RNA polymerase omega subunit
MAYVDLEKLLEKANFSVYKLVVMASRRALEIAENQSKQLDSRILIKASSLALQEIIDGKVGYRIKKSQE